MKSNQFTSLIGALGLAVIGPSQAAIVVTVSESGGTTTVVWDDGSGGTGSLDVTNPGWNGSTIGGAAGLTTSGQLGGDFFIVRDGVTNPASRSGTVTVPLFAPQPPVGSWIGSGEATIDDWSVSPGSSSFGFRGDGNGFLYFDTISQVGDTAFAQGSASRPGNLITNGYFTPGTFVYTLNNAAQDTITVNVVPEPTSALLLGLGGLGLLAHRRRK